jgi:opacity protein-like surface antigen
MKSIMGIFVLLALATIPAMAQNETPIAEVSAGYTFRQFNFFGSTINSNGFNVGAVYNVNRWLGAAADFDGTYSNQGENGAGWIDTYLFGPRVYPLGHHRLTPFAHVMFGGSHISINFPATMTTLASTSADSDFAWEAGGGVDWTVASHIAVRLGEFDYEQTRFFGGNPNQNNFKYKAAIVFRLGNK